jgi:hypothetical protein
MITVGNIISLPYDIQDQILLMLSPSDIIQYMHCSTLIRKYILPHKQNTCGPFNHVYTPQKLWYTRKDTRMYIQHIDGLNTITTLYTCFPAVTSLVLGKSFNEQLLFHRDSNIQSLTVNELPYSMQPGYLPSRLTTLIFSGLSQYNFPLFPGMLPDSLETITLSYSYTHPIPMGILPEKLKNITFGTKFNLPLPEVCFPSSIRNISFGDNFNQIIRVGELPEGVRRLSFGIRYTVPLFGHTLPRSLIFLEFRPGGTYNHPLCRMPSTLRYIDFGDTYTHKLPYTPRLQEIRFGALGDFNRSLQHITPAIHTIHMSFSFNRSLSCLTYTSLHTLIIGDMYNTPIGQNVLPDSLRHLCFGEEFNHPFAHGVLPEKLETLIFTRFSMFNHPITHVLPKSICHLAFGYKFNQPVEHLPPNIHTIIFGRDFNFTLTNLPSSLCRLELYPTYGHTRPECAVDIPIRKTQHKYKTRLVQKLF